MSHFVSLHCRKFNISAKLSEVNLLSSLRLQCRKTHTDLFPPVEHKLKLCIFPFQFDFYKYLNTSLPSRRRIIFLRDIVKAICFTTDVCYVTWVTVAMKL